MITVPPHIRPAAPTEAVQCPFVEREASALFRDTEFPWLVGQAADAEVYERAARRKDLLVACDGGRKEEGEDLSKVVGFVLLRSLGADALYVAELGVLPTHQGQRLGARLLDAAEKVAHTRLARWLVLRTFKAVPWNAPYYRRLGFTDPPPGLSDQTWRELAAVAAKEVRHGLSEHNRLFLARPVRVDGQTV